MNKVAVSVVIPTFQRVHLLAKCLDALQMQTCNISYEVIVVSDGTDAETAALLNKYQQKQGARYSFLSLPEKRGPASARNRGWQFANGELIAFTDDDTQPASLWLQTFWEAYQASGKREIAFTGNVIVPIPKRPTDYERNTAGLETAEFVTANCACTQKALQTIGGFDEAFTMAWREDSELEFKLITHHIPIVKVPAAQVLHPVRNAGWGVSLKEQKKSMYNALLYKKHPRLFREKILASPLWNYYAIIFCFMLSIVLFIFHSYFLAVLSAAAWFFLTVFFAKKRLHGSCLSVSHISEMLVTSIFIPFLSVYWTLYGAYKFKVFFL